MSNKVEKKIERPPFDKITKEWIEAKMKEHAITEYEFSLQVSKSRGYWSDIKLGRISRITAGVKSGAWHFFKRIEKQ